MLAKHEGKMMMMKSEGDYETRRVAPGKGT